LIMRNFDAVHMCVLLDGASLKVESRGPVPPPRAKSAVLGGGAGAAAGVEERYSVHLPPGARPGTLTIRRPDGVLYHTKWALRRAAVGPALELVACNMAI
ncbi:hypothetical protein H4R19_006510, partial [Coemansia spiralis]